MRRLLAVCPFLLALLAGCATPTDPIEQPHRLSSAWLDRMFGPEHMAEDTARLVHEIRRMFVGEFARLPAARR
jgi:hypothetical protein